MLAQSYVQGPVGTERTQTGGGRWSEKALGGDQPGRDKDECSQAFGGNRGRGFPAREHPGALWPLYAVTAGPGGPGFFLLPQPPRCVSRFS